VFREGHAAMDQPSAFAFEQATLEAGKGFADHDTAAGSDNAVPGNGLAARASSHGSTGGTSAAGEPRGAGQLAVGDDARFGNALDQFVEFAPACGHVPKDSRKGRELPVLPL
jgi:hypothetical protein